MQSFVKGINVSTHKFDDHFLTFLMNDDEILYFMCGVEMKERL